MAVQLPAQLQPISQTGGPWSRAWYEWAWRITAEVNAGGGGGGGGAPTNATYVTLSTDPTLTAERVLTAGTGISLTDGGPGGPVTIASTVTSGAPTNAQYVTLATNAGLSAERVLTAGTGILITDGGANGPVTVASTTASGVIELDFGGSVMAEVDIGTVTVADVGVTANSEIIVSLQYAATADHSADEALISNVQLLPGVITAGVGFEIKGYAPEFTWGKYSVHWIRTA
jgi:hypothetical protein